MFLSTSQRSAYVGFGNTAEAAADAVVGRRRRGVPADGRFDRRTGAGHVVGLFMYAFAARLSTRQLHRDAHYDQADLARGRA